VIYGLSRLNKLLEKTAMIETPTTFILGAGAHRSYGFPTGEQLKTKIIGAVEESLREDSRDSFLLLETYKVAKYDEVQPSVCRHFIKALTNSGQPSIDAFLNSNSHIEGFSKIGKGAIAKVLLAHESSAEDSEDDDWLKYLFQVMLEGVRAPSEFIDKNNVSFVTYNYDRFLESWLYSRIQSSFGLSDSEALDILNQIPIVHIYGMLGKFPIPQEEIDDRNPWVPASVGIRTIFESEVHSGELENANALLDSSHKICLLGFGFHRENIELLKLHERSSAQLYATRFDLREAEWNRLTTIFGARKPISHQYTTKSLMFLRTINVL
jgi:hypothetical protein